MGLRFVMSAARTPGNALVVAMALLAASCATGPASPPPDTAGLPSVPPPSAGPVPGQLYRETGMASWYGRDLHGRKTANGETFDMYGLSAAHRTLPLGTLIRVTNLNNYKSIKVAVNDRGPFARNRVLDLSYGAARELGFVAQGTTQVRIESLEVIQEGAVYTVQAAAFVEQENAQQLRQRLAGKFENVAIVPVESNSGTFYRVRVGGYPSEEKAEAVAGKLQLEGVEPVVVRKD